MSELRIRQLTTIAEMEDVVALFDRLWPPGEAGSVISAEMLRALTKAGNYLAGAYSGAELIGASAGFFGPPEARRMHSHVTGVSAPGGQVGLALKLDQRDWALRHGIETISWTFDPLVSRNAYFNFSKLGARAAEYLPDFYGEMTDGVNRGAGSDRILVEWDLTAPPRPRADPGGATVALGRTADGAPEPGSATGSKLLIATPSDVESMRRDDPAKARAWRSAVRDVLAPRITDVVGFDRDGWYVVQRGEDGR
jgi:predicted GNAT superfamily acetyltransferase